MENGRIFSVSLRHLRNSRRVSSDLEIAFPFCSWKGRQIPVVKFLNGREMVVTPEKFTSDVPGTGTCKRTQVGFVPANSSALLSYPLPVHNDISPVLVFVDLVGNREKNIPI